MNIYTVNFSAKCPVNGRGIKYRLEVHAGAVLMVEDLRSHVDAIGEGLHEDIADALLAKFGGSQRLEAEHHGVHIKTIRPHLEHWDKPSKPSRGMTKAEMRHAAEHDTSCVGAFARARP